MSKAWEQGYAAGKAGKSPESNPWPIGRTLGFQWHYGRNNLPRPEAIEAQT